MWALKNSKKGTEKEPSGFNYSAFFAMGKRRTRAKVWSVVCVCIACIACMGEPIKDDAAARKIKDTAEANLPYDAEVEYLRNTGLTQYIDTGIIGGTGLYVQTTIRPLELANDKWAIGSWDANARIYVAYQYSSSGRGGYWGGGYGAYFSGTDDTSFQNNQIQTLDIQFTDTEQILSIDGVERQRWNKDNFTGTVTRSLWLFGAHGTSTEASATAFHCEIGETKIWMNDTLLRDFIPVRLTNELGQSEGAMYDRVSGELFRNQGTGSFIIGPDKK